MKSPNYLQHNLNTILMFIVIGTLGFIGLKSTDNNERLVQLEERGKSAEATLLRLERALGELVTRREFDASLAKTATEYQVVQTELARINVRLRELDLLYLELKGNLLKLTGGNAGAQIK
jgi:hypothetical protein